VPLVLRSAIRTGAVGADDFKVEGFGWLVHCIGIMRFDEGMSQTSVKG
jgi:hypothetical protein